MRAHEFTDPISPELQRLIDSSVIAGEKMAASNKFKYQLYVPRKQTSVFEDFKPNAELWTSTAIKNGPDTYTSEWVEWCWRGGKMTRDWISKTGTLYKIQTGAKILHIGSDAAALKIAKILGHTFPSQYARLSLYPWEALREHFDAIHYPARLSSKYSSRLNNIMMNLWDVESTAWYNTSKLSVVEQVNVKARDW